jgi:lysyl-tRNA synthetase class 2
MHDDQAPAPLDFQPTASWANLRQRAALLRRVRQSFHNRDFLEVETPCLSADTVIDRYLEPLRVPLPAESTVTAGPRGMWLQTSPEFHMKRLLASGGQALFQVAHAFRWGERGCWHNPEFTLVEWYRVGDSMRAAMQLLSDLCHEWLARGAAEFATYSEVFQRYAGVDPHTATIDELRAACRARDVPAPDSLTGEDRDGWLNLLLAAVVQPVLGLRQPVIVCDFPASQAALARVRPETPPLAERFELFIDGVELANGYHELLDTRELAARNAETNRQRAGDGKSPLPEHSRLLEAMRAGLPECSGVALGFDRLAMLVVGARDIGEVLPFPWERA